jgi:hypothetical protein
MLLLCAAGYHCVCSRFFCDQGVALLESISRECVGNLECVALVGVVVVEFFQTNIPSPFAGLHLGRWGEQSSSSALLFSL